MQQPAQLRAIYQELRRAAGDSIPAGDLVRLAHLILKSYLFEKTGRDDEPEVRFDRAFASLPVDVAMKDGGWRILSFEEERAAGVENLDAGEFEALRRHIEKFLGPEWQTRIPPG